MTSPRHYHRALNERGATRASPLHPRILRAATAKNPSHKSSQVYENALSRLYSGIESLGKRLNLPRDRRAKMLKQLEIEAEVQPYRGSRKIMLRSGGQAFRVDLRGIPKREVDYLARAALEAAKHEGYNLVYKENP